MRSVYFIVFVFVLAMSQTCTAADYALLTGPVAQDDDNFTYQDFSVSGTLADNDYDPDGDPLTYSLVTGTPDGTITINQDGSYLYVPNPLAYGVEYITYQVCDDDGNCAQALLTMFVIFLNDDPIAVNDLITAETSSPYNGNAGINDIEPDNEIRHYNLITPPANGTLTFNSNGTFIYTSFGSFTGSDSFVYEICDPCLRCDEGLVSINVVGNNASPIVSDSPTWTLNEDGSYSGSLAGLVTDPETDPITFNISADPDHGSVELQPDGSFIFTPSPNYFGSDLFEFEACDLVSQCDFGLVYLEIAGVNDPPNLQNDELNVNEDNQLNGNVSGNDTDDETAQLSYSVINAVDNGALSMSSNGTFTYTPDPNFNGDDLMTYQACDGGGLCQTALLTIHVLPVNDPPSATNNYFAGPEDTDISENTGPASDTENDPLTFTLIGSPLNGGIFMDVDGTFIFTPNENWYGTEDLEFEVCDNQGGCSQGILSLEILPVNDPPVALDDLTDFAFEDQQITGNLLNNDIDADNDLLTYSTTDLAQHGDFILDEYGTYTYMPDFSWFGVETFTITVCDGQNQCDQSILSFEIVSVNDGIIAQNGNGGANEDAVLSGTLVGLAIDLDNDPITFTALSVPANGILNLLPNGTFTYTPNANFSGNDQFTFSACDPFSACDDAIYFITVTPVNDSPIANEDEFSGNEDTQITGNVGTNDQDIDSSNLSYSIISQPMFGAATLDTNGDLEYQPESNFYGIDFITYEVCDGSLCDATTVTLSVSQVNDLPVGDDDSFNVMTNALLSGDLSLNDSDVESSQLFYTISSDVSHGTLTLNTNGNFTYLSDLDYSGIDLAVISVCDEQDDCVFTTLEIGVLANQSSPNAVADEFTMPEDGLLTASVATNDSDVDGGVLTFTLLSAIDHGSLTFSSDGSFTLDTDPNFNGSISFTYEVCDETDLCSLSICTVEVSPINDSPLAVDDYAFFISNGVLTGNVGTNDYDVDNDDLTFHLIAPPQYGEMTFNEDGSFVYTSMSIFDGLVVALYEVCDGTTCNSGSFVIEVSFLNTLPIVIDDSFVLNENTPLTASISANDSEPNGEILMFYLGIEPFGIEPSHGTATIGFNSGLISYTPFPGFFGQDTLSYYACDPCGDCVAALVIFTVLPVNDAPVTTTGELYVYDDTLLEGNLIPYVSDPDGTELSFSLEMPPANGDLIVYADGSFTYTPDPDFLGIDSFTYEVCDQELCSIGAINIEVIYFNDPPIAGDDEYVIVEDTELNGDLSLNDSDSDVNFSNPLYLLLETPQEGELVLDADGTFSYIPGDGFSGTEILQYQVCDEMNLCDTAYISIEVTFVNDPPSVENEFIILTDNNEYNGDVSLNDSDEENFDLLYSIVTDASHGTLVLSANGTFVYTPTGDFTGEDVITYLVCDDLTCFEGTLIFLLIGNNNPPLVAGESVNVLEDDDVTSSVSTNDSDPDGDELTYTITEGPFHGSIEMDQDGNFTYVPELNFYGVDFLIYSVCDPYTACVEGTLQIVVDFVNDIPIAEDDFVTTTENTIVEGSVAGNDIEYDDEILTYDILEDQSNGIFELNPDGSFSYLPNDGAIGTFFVYYEACDPCGACNDALLTITVEPQIIENTTPVTEAAAIQLCLASSASINMNDFVSDPEDSDDDLSFNFTFPMLGVYEFNSNTHVLNCTSDQLTADDVEILYTVCDNGNPQMCASGTILIDIISTNEIYINDVFVQNVACFGETNGSIEIIEISGEGPFTVSWDNGESGLELSELSAGDYPLTINSSAPCSFPTFNILTVSGPFAPVTAELVGSGNITDDTNGSIDIAVTGGTSPYFIEWFGPNNYNVESEDATEITTAGLYTALISDLNGCDAEIEVNITPVEEIDSPFDVMVSPNPSSGIYNLILNGTNGREVSIKVYDAAGRVVLDQNQGSYASGRRTTIDLTSFSKGIYELLIMAGSTHQTIRLLKNE
ncbi:MAG: Ig-like domain-containing protein [Flavobacteriales bacterium]